MIFCTLQVSIGCNIMVTIRSYGMLIVQATFILIQYAVATVHCGIFPDNIDVSLVLFLPEVHS